MATDSHSLIELRRQPITVTEQRQLERAERTIARGLKSFIVVGMALKMVRDQCLYRQDFATFEEYCIKRWDFSRPRAYELLGASEVMGDLSAIADIRVLPENEFQTRPLTRLKSPAQRRRAWKLALKIAAAEDRLVCARDTEEAVRSLKVNGRARGFRGPGPASRLDASGSTALFQVYCGHAIKLAPTLPMANCVVTSPPFYGKRRYGTSNHELGQEKTVDEYVSRIVAVFDAIQLHPAGSLWVNIGDTRGREGLLLVPERFVIAMVERGWHLVDDVIWAKTVVQTDGSTTGHCMVEPTVYHNRLNGNAFDHLYRFTKCLPGEAWTIVCAVGLPRQGTEDVRYLPDELMTVHSSVVGRGLPNVWQVAVANRNQDKHYAQFPPALCERPIAMTCPMRVCRVCGHLRSRITKAVPYDEKRGPTRIFGKYLHHDGEERQVVSGRKDGGRLYVPKMPVTVRWSDCGHDAWTQGVVVDPFMGTGVTGDAALRLGRAFVGVDLYEDHVGIARERCGAVLRQLKENKLDPAALER